MGKRSQTQTITQILVAFLNQRTWQQKELADRCEVQTRTLKIYLDNLTLAGVPLEREVEHPHVYWSVPAGWLPAAVALERDAVARLARLVARLPQDEQRERALSELLGATSLAQPLRNDEISTVDGEVLAALEDSVLRRAPLLLRYFSLSRGSMEDRPFSVQRVLHGEARCIAVCHRDGQLKILRLDRVERAQPLENGSFVEADAASVGELLQQRFMGFHGTGEPINCVFSVREPQARWVRHNLPAKPALVEQLDGEVRFSVLTAALEQLGRYVVGLGAAARAETPALAAEVMKLARGALQANAARHGLDLAKAPARGAAKKARQG